MPTIWHGGPNGYWPKWEDLMAERDPSDSLTPDWAASRKLRAREIRRKIVANVAARTTDMADGPLDPGMVDPLPQPAEQGGREERGDHADAGRHERMQLGAAPDTDGERGDVDIVAGGETPKYPPTTAGRHLMEKFRSTVM